MTIRYRPEIDGLRAIAVIGVLLCHANFAFFGGGFVGVDIFFVISGFLITSLIERDLKEGSFSFKGFWERRIRRILPPLLLVIFCSVAAGWFLYLPGDYDQLGQQVASQAVFASNILFKSQSGYFGTENSIKPLLHTWSLAVEEQFYFFFPVALYFIWKRRKDKAFKYLAIFSGVSFVAASFIVRNSPSSAFYLLPFRAWELLLGSLIALRPQVYTGLKKEIIGFAGVLAILASMLFYNDKMLFPGATALLPCLGAVAIIVSNTGGLNRVGKILSMRVPVFIGLVSYSLYLWHWPILALVRYNGLFEFTHLIALLCLGAAFVLAVLSWRYVERPFRQKKVFPTTKGIYIAALLCLVILATSGLAIHFTKGVPKRLPEDVVLFANGAEDVNPYRESCNKPKFDRFENGEICQANVGEMIDKTFVLWGDSYADAIAPAFYDLARKYDKNGYIVTAHGCPPILGYQQNADLAFDCVGFNDRVLKMIRQNKIKNVILAGSWNGKMRNSIALFKDESWYPRYQAEYDDITSAGLKRTVDKLQILGVKVYIFVDVPSASFNPPRILAMKALYKANSDQDIIRVEDYNAARKAHIDEFIAKNQNSGITFIDPRSLMCDDKTCKVSDKGRSLFFNSDHISKYGALYLEDLFKDYFKNDF